MSGLDAARENIIVLAAIVAAAGYLWKSFKSGSDTIDDRVISGQNEIIGQQEAKISALEKEVAHLSGQVHQLSEENTTLRNLVMGEAVPDALKRELTGIASRIEKRVAELEDNTSSALAAVADRILRQMQPEGGL